MTFFRLLIRNLVYHWRGNLAVFLGITLGAAVLTGALLVGDSLRGSLRALTLEQLGWVEQAMVPGRFFRAALADAISSHTERRAAVLLLQGSAARRGPDGKALQPVGRVTVLGIGGSFWPDGAIPEGAEFWASDAREVVLNRTLAAALATKIGETIKLRVQRPDSAPGETLLGQRKADRVVEEIEVKVRAILPDEGMARFSLKPTPEPVRNAFVPIGLLQKRKDLQLAGKANALLIASAAPGLHAKLTLEDWGLRYLSPSDRALAFVRFLDENNTDGKVARNKWRGRVPADLAEQADADGILTAEQIVQYYEERRDYSVLQSTRMLLEPAVVRAVEKVAPRNEQPRWDWKPNIIYLADRLSVGANSVPYAIIAGDERVPDDERILLTDWPGSPLKVTPEDTVKITYYAPDERNHLKLKEAAFSLLLFPLPRLEGVLDDPDLTPAFPGVTDKLNIGSWQNTPFPYDPARIKPGDANEKYWERFRTTPRAYISLKKAKELWGTRFGDITSIQVRSGLDHPDFFPAVLLDELKPEQGGFIFQPVKEQALSASSGATDFGVLFLSFSVFLIVAALLLVGLLVRLNMDRRAAEMGVLLATGWNHAQVRRLLLGECAVLAVAGVLAGIGGALGYGYLMLKLLAANWPGGESLNFLRLHAEPASFAIGSAASLLVSLATLWWATRSLGRFSPRALLHGDTTVSAPLGPKKSGYAPIITVVALLVAGATVVLGVRSPDSAVQAAMFFCSGALLLTSAISAIWVYLRWLGHESSPQPSLVRLGIRNAGRQAARSVLTVGLLASASFVVVAVESFHKDADKHFYEKSGGSGGFAFFAEGNVPVFEDLNAIDVRHDHGLDTPELRTAEFYSCRVQTGDDASCLSLYKPLKPRVLGVSKKLIDRGGFSFAASLAETDAEKANPWLLLEKKADGAISVIMDGETAEWILKVKLGDFVEVNNEQGEPVKLRIVALLHESIFQSELVIAETQFLSQYPRQAGFAFHLVDLGHVDDPSALEPIQRQLQSGLTAFNLDVQTTAARLQGYLAVRNTYLATFQALGGLGLVLGAMGLAIVLLRGVWERRAELALLLALGFRPGQLAQLVLFENVFLLALGLAAGTVSALVAVAPHLIGSGAQVLWLRIAGLLAGVLVVGLSSAALAVWATLKTPVLTALRRE